MGTFDDRTPGDSIETLRAGDSGAPAAPFDRHRDRIRRMVELRLAPRPRGRLAAADVVLDSSLDVAGDLDDLSLPPAPAPAAPRPAVDRPASPAPGHAVAGRGPGDLDRSRRPAPGQPRRDGLDAFGPARLDDPGRPPRPADAPLPGGAERPRSH